MVGLLYIGIFLAACLLGYVVFILFAAHHFTAVKVACKPVPADLFISVIVAARNEAAGIHYLLESLRLQSYPSDLWECIIIDDQSDDETAALVHAFIKKYSLPNMKVITSAGVGKKSAIETGVEQAQGKWMLQTDADCIVGHDWISAMAGYMRDEIKFVSGPIRLIPGNSWFERLQALEMLGLVTLGAGSMMAGFPNMANGANMAYHRQTFLELGGFGSSKEVASGDDEFLVQSIRRAFPGGLTFAKCSEAIVDTATMSTWHEFRRQRIRWVSKAKSYINRSTNLIQMMAWLGFLAFPWWILICMINISFVFVPVGLFLMKLLADRWLMKSGALFLQRPGWSKWLLLLEIVYIPYVIWIGIKGNLNGRYVWKGRKTT